MNFDMNEALSSKWMSRTDVPQHGVDLTIREVTKETVGETKDVKFALHFHGSYKPLLMNKTAIRTLTQLFGAASKNWANQIVNVYDDPNVSYGGKQVGGVRLRQSQAQQAKADTYQREQIASANSPKILTAVPPGFEKMDDIPF